VRTTLELPLSLQFPATVRTAHPTKNGILVFSKSRKSDKHFSPAVVSQNRLKESAAGG
jgi:hypothetical protein